VPRGFLYKPQRRPLGAELRQVLIDLVTVDTLDGSEVPCGGEERVALNEVVQGRECRMFTAWNRCCGGTRSLVVRAELPPHDGRPLVPDAAAGGRDFPGPVGHQALKHGGEPGRLAPITSRGRRVNILSSLLRDGQCYEPVPPTALAA
jgi:hypothetical protein